MINKADFTLLLGVAFHHLVTTIINAYTCIVNPLQTWLIETESNMG